MLNVIPMINTKNRSRHANVFIGWSMARTVFPKSTKTDNNNEKY